MIPTVYVKFLTPDPDVGPPPEPSGLRRFYTVAFDAKIMEQALWFEHGHLEAGIWVDGVVPKRYRARVREIVLKVFEKSFRGRVFRPVMMDAFVDELRRAIWRDLEPDEPCCENHR